MRELWSIVDTRDTNLRETHSQRAELDRCRHAPAFHRSAAPIRCESMLRLADKELGPTESISCGSTTEIARARQLSWDSDRQTKKSSTKMAKKTQASVVQLSLPSSSESFHGDDHRCILPAKSLNEDHKQRLQCMSNEIKLHFVQQTLKLFHFTEFLLLIEFAEYYANLRNLDDASLQHNTVNVMIYTSLEVVSFVMLAALVSRKLKISPLKQLSFVLQPKLILWVDHFDVDYSFKLHKIA